MPPSLQAELDVDLLKSWIGRTQSAQDVVSIGSAQALAATLDQVTQFNLGDALPPLWHWIYFWAVSPQSALGEDGHPQRGGFLPPVPLPRRMWAGGRLRFDHAIPIGSTATRDSRIEDVKIKSGASGQLAFVTVSHQLSIAGQVAVVEEHDIVYRDHPQAGAPSAQPKLAPTDAVFSRTITPDPVLLFRYSALTFNGHRIHYDRNYVTEVEGYPGLIVHGPLIATLLIELVRSHYPQRQIQSFDFRAVSPLFDTASFSVHARPEQDGKTIQCWAANPHGELAMQAVVILRSE
jgi:3-methylfumaryl-CoA hydratase